MTVISAKGWEGKVDGTKITKEQVTANKFYVGSRDALRRAWGHKNINGAIKHATELLDNNGDEQFIVKIVRVVRRKKPPVDIEVVK